MKLISWNVNGIRSILNNGFLDWLSETDPDIVCLQETKISERDLDEHVPSFRGYASYWHSAERSGYSGVALLTKQEPLSLTRGLGKTEFDCEGRILTAEFDTFFLVNIYVPNVQISYARLPFRLAWDEALRTYLTVLQEQKSLIICGDFNVAPTALDIGIPDVTNFPGCSAEERTGFNQLIELGLTDTFRFLHPTRRAYSWWAYANQARSWNQGLRFDYILVSNQLRDQIRSAETHHEILGSDHGPVSLELDRAVGGQARIQIPVSPSGQFGFEL